MARVLVTHADLPIGRRIVKVLWHDPAVETVVAIGGGPAPRGFEAFRVGPEPRLRYETVDLARSRSVSDLFRSRWLRERRVDHWVHVPRHGVLPDGPELAGRVPVRTAEARLLLHHALESRTLRAVVALGSAFVYRLEPGNANHLTERSPLDLDPDLPAARRSWIDCDMLFQAEASGRRLRVALLRLPTVVASGGFVYLNPALEGSAGLRLRLAGFDPLQPVVADKDVAHAVAAALHASAAGPFNVCGLDRLPLSVLGTWTGRPCVPVPGPLLRAAARLAGDGARAVADGPYLRFGMSLDTTRAARELGFEPRYRVGVVRAGDGALRLEAAAV